MATKLDEARKLLEKRLEEIDTEREQLVAAISQLDGVAGGSTTGSTRRTGAGRKPGGARRRNSSSNGRRKRAPRGKREEQLLSSIRANPEYRVADHARVVGVKPQQLYPILGRLVQKDVIVKKDHRYELKGEGQDVCAAS